MGKLVGWAVHLFTASGLIFCFASLLAMNEQNFRMAFVWLFVALIVDGFDGMLARAADVTRHLPGIQGKIMDHLIDFIGYAFLPAYFFHISGLLPEGYAWLGTGVILMSSILYYAKDGMVSEDYYFVGFPVLWNLVAFYLFCVFHLPPFTNLVLIVLLGIMHFIPLKYAYPSRMKGHRWFVWIITLSGLTAAAVLIWTYPQEIVFLQWLLILVLIGFTFLVVWTSFHLSRARSPGSRSNSGSSD